MRLRATRGRCRLGPPRLCVIGTLAAGATATVRVTARARRAGRFRNVVAANTAARVRSLRRMAAAATVRVLERRGGRFTG